MGPCGVVVKEQNIGKVETSLIWPRGHEGSQKPDLIVWITSEVVISWTGHPEGQEGEHEENMGEKLWE